MLPSKGIPGTRQVKYGHTYPSDIRSGIPWFNVSLHCKDALITQGPETNKTWGLENKTLNLLQTMSPNK